MQSILKSSQLNIIKAFVDEWKIRTSAKTILYIRNSNFGIFSAVNFDDSHIVASSDEITYVSKFDLIVGDLPFGLPRVEIEHQKTKLRIPDNWGEIIKSLMFLNESGTAIYLLEPLGFSTVAGQKFEKELNKSGFYVSGFFNAPEKMLQPEMSITPIFVAITKSAPSKIFIAELLNEKQTVKVVGSYFSSTGGIDLRTGKYIDLGSYHGFHRQKIRQQIECLETQYKNYTEYTLGNLAIEINSVSAGKEFIEKDNTIYVPKIGKSPVVSTLSETKLKHHNYFQVVLRELALSEYVSAFFKSALGHLVLESLTSQTFIAHLDKRDLEQALVALPRLEDQELIVHTRRRLVNLKSAVDEFDIELALNPISSNSIQRQLDSMLNVIGGLTDADKVYGLIREGESKYAEFKETLSLDIRKKMKEKYIETSALKTVVAFLNTDGGVLLIGISDAGAVMGINNEIGKFYKGKDDFLLHWKNLLKERIGEEYYPFLEYKIINVREKPVLWVDCKPSPSPCFLDQKDFYIRVNPASDKLEGQKLVEYVRNHFSK